MPRKIRRDDNLLQSERIGKGQDRYFFGIPLISGRGVRTRFSVPEPWIDTQCAVCGGLDGASILDVPHADAPHGVSAIWRCGQCGLRRLRPRPGARDLARYYGEAAGYNAFVGRKRSSRSQKIWNFLRDCSSRPEGRSTWTRWVGPVGARIAEWAFDINVPLDGRRGLRVLEVGSGYGDILIYLKSRGCEVLGTDLSEAGARKGAEYGVEIRVGNLADLKLPSASFDVAILCHSLEHVPDPNVELAELARVLRPGGRIHLAVPNGNAVRLRLDGQRWDHLSHPFHFWYFDPRTIQRLLGQHGFVPVQGPTTTTRHHAWTAWRHDLRCRGLRAANRRLLAYLRASARRWDGGDVLRVVAELQGIEAGERLLARLDRDRDGTKPAET